MVSPPPAPSPDAATAGPPARILQLPAAVEVVGLVLLGIITAVLEVLYLPVRVGAVPVPVGAVAAAVTNAVLVWAAGERSLRLGVAAAPLGAWVLVVLGCAFSGPGGDVLLVDDWRALLLLVAGVVPASLVLGVLMGRAGTARAQVQRPVAPRAQSTR